MSLPSNVPNSVVNLSKLVDDIWYFAGDRSTTVINAVSFLLKIQQQILIMMTQTAVPKDQIHKISFFFRPNRQKAHDIHRLINPRN